eukprot:6050928-Pleurochrysis_carterae.AAC.1
MAVAQSRSCARAPENARGARPKRNQGQAGKRGRSLSWRCGATHGSAYSTGESIALSLLGAALSLASSYASLHFSLRTTASLGAPLGAPLCVAPTIKNY